MRAVKSCCSEKGGADGDLLLLCANAQSFEQKKESDKDATVTKGSLGFQWEVVLFDLEKEIFFPQSL